MERPTCQTCPYWDAFGTFNSVLQIANDCGECHRFPAVLPTPDCIAWDKENNDSNFAFDGVWPNTYDHNWCGEHPDFPAYIRSLKQNEEGCVSISVNAVPGMP